MNFNHMLPNVITARMPLTPLHVIMCHVIDYGAPMLEILMQTLTVIVLSQVITSPDRSVISWS